MPDDDKNKDKRADAVAAALLKTYEPAAEPTSAADYRKHVVEKRPDEPTFLVGLPSGKTFRLRIPDVPGYMMTGRMPESLVFEFLKSAEARGLTIGEAKAQADSIANEVAMNASEKDTKDSLIFMRELVREACVQPRIGFGEDELDPSEVSPADFKYIFQWVLTYSGVAGLKGLQTFRSRRERRANASGAHRKKLRRQTVHAGRN